MFYKASIHGSSIIGHGRRELRHLYSSTAMELSFERLLPCGPEIAFLLISDPARMNLWSTARVRPLASGDGDHPGGVGALREVHLGGRGGRVIEEVIEAAEPPHRFEYRVIGGVSARSHHGRIQLTPVRGGTRLEWHVEVAFPVPGMGVVARRQIRPAMERSLDRLVEVAGSAAPGTLPPVRSLGEGEALPALYGEAKRVVAEQRELAGELRRARDPRGPLTRAYQDVSEAWVAACREGRFAHASWVLRLLVRVHRHYATNLARWLHREAGPVDDHWAAVFSEAARAKRGPEARVRVIEAGMRACIDEDLPQALAEVYVEHYAGHCDYARFRADFLRAGGEADAALARLAAWMRRPFGARVVHRMLPAGAAAALTERPMAAFAARRRRAFGRGERIVRLLAERARE